MSSALYTVGVVAASSTFIGLIHAFTHWLRKAFGHKKWVESLTRERGVNAKPDANSLRAGLK